MVSKIEILEFLLKNGPIRLKDLKKVFGSGIHETILLLTRSGFLKRFILKYNQYGEPVKIYLKPSELKQGKRYTYVELSENAINYLKRYNAESFFDTPMAQISRIILKRDFLKI